MIRERETLLGYIQKDSVFILVTPRFWKMKDKWIEAKKSEGIWKDVKVYDSSNLQQWLDIALYVSRWFSSQIGTYPFDGIMTSDEFWEEWSRGPNGLILMPEVVTSGREYERGQILSALQGPASIKGVKAPTKNEAIAFIIAAAKQFAQSESERFFSKSLIIDTEGNFRGIRINTTSPLNLIPRFEETQPLYSAVSKGHHVLVPLGADDSFNQETINLPTIDRGGQINSLVKSGLSREDAEKFSREAGRNITIMKKLLGFPLSKAKWIKTENIREIIPALLLGRWNERFIGDIELIEKLSGLRYEEYLATLTKWRNLEESPLLQIGETWRLTSPLDLWANLSQYLTKRDFEILHECFDIAFKNGNPPIENDNQNELPIFDNKKRKFSNWSREGLTQSLILVGRFGEGLNIPNLSNPQLWVDSIIHDLLNEASGEMWISVDHELPLISEASPVSFIKAVSNSLSKDQPEIMDMFKEMEGFLYSTSNHTGLLWALEGLAWLPEYLTEVSLILLKLSRLDPGGHLANRPINSISEIFKPWHYQTLAPFEERMKILKYITKKEPEAGWTLLIRMLPNHDIAQQTHKMRWRIFDKNTNLSYTNQEIWDIHSHVVSLLLELFENDEKKFAQLIDESANLSPHDRDTILNWAESNYLKVHQIEFTTWHTIRRILNDQRSHSDTNWALNEVELKRYEKIYENLKPSDALNQYIWLFDDYFPLFPEGFKYDGNEMEKKLEQQQSKIDAARTEAVKIIVVKFGLSKTIDLRKSVKESWTLGEALAKIITDKTEILEICECLNDDKENLRFVYSFISRKSLIDGFKWVTELFKDLQEEGFNNKALANILIPLNQSIQLWNFVSSLGNEIQAEYWQNVYPQFYHTSIDEKIIGIQMLIKYNRFFSAIHVCSHFVEEIPTELISGLLQKAVTEKSEEPANIRNYEIVRIFETMDKRTDLDSTKLINLEWLYLPILTSYGTKRSPKVLHEELSKNPAFFVDVLKWIYKPKDEETIEEEDRKGISDDAIQNRARQAYDLLSFWKNIPGLRADNLIDEKVLREWIDKARDLAKLEKRLEVADMHIGQVLAQYPENIPEWPHEKIFEIIENINSDSVRRNYSSAMFNKRSSSTRGPFDGGEIERGHAKYFEKLANDYKNKYPNVSEIFQKLSVGYLLDAKRMDENAERDRLEY